jgi:UPF0716 protein FxsA
MRRRTPWWLLALAFIAVPVLEIYVIIQVGQVIGAWWTILLLVVDGVVGSWLVKHEGRRAWRALRAALEAGRMPSTELADGMLILVGGTLMISPGFVTDVVGVLLILPFTRPLGRRVLTRFVNRRLRGRVQVMTATPRTARRPGTGPDGTVVQGEVVDGS